MSAGEILLIFFVALMLFGSKSLPGFAKTLGKAYREFKRASDDIKQELAQNAEINELKREIDSLRNDVSGKFSGIHDSVSTEVTQTKSTVLNEVETVNNPLKESSVSNAINTEPNFGTDSLVESDYQHDIYKEAAEKAASNEYVNLPIDPDNAAELVSAKQEETSVSSNLSISRNN